MFVNHRNSKDEDPAEIEQALKVLGLNDTFDKELLLQQLQRYGSLQLNLGESMTKEEFERCFDCMSSKSVHKGPIPNSITTKDFVKNVLM